MKAQYMFVLLLSVLFFSACSNDEYASKEKRNIENTNTTVITTIPEPEHFDPFNIESTPTTTTATRETVTTSNSATTSQSLTTTEAITTTAETTSNSSLTKAAVTTTKAATNATVTTTSWEEYTAQKREQERSKYMNGKCGDNISYTLNDNGVLTIQGIGEMYDYDVIGSPFYNGNGNEWYGVPPIKEIIISDGITTIGDNAFSLCTCLKKVSFPVSVVSIGDSAFQNCWGITEISLPDSVLTIGNSCFNGCYGIKSFKMSSNIEYVDDWALGNLRDLESITFPKGTRFGGFVFDNDPKLTIRCYASEETEKLKTSGCKIELIEE